jgi:hypothetical protein
MGGGSQSLSHSQDKLEAFQIQSSAYGVCIPLVWGVNRIAGNLLWYGNFSATAHETANQGGGKGGSPNMVDTTYTYAADLIMAVCAGLVSSIPRVWKGQAASKGGVDPSTYNILTEYYTVSGSRQFTPLHTIRQIIGVSQGYPLPPLAQGVDFTFDSASSKITFSADFTGQQLLITYQWLSGSTGQQSLDELGLSFAPGAIDQPLWGPLTSIAPSNEQLRYPGLCYVAGQQYRLGNAAQLENHNFEVVGRLAYGSSTSLPDVDGASFLTDLLIGAGGGAQFPASRLADLTTYSDYCLASGLLLSPAITSQQKAADLVAQCLKLTNSAGVWSGNQLRIVPYGDKSLTANGRTYTANTTPLYDLDDNHFLDNENPIQIADKAAADRYNHFRIEWCNRGAWDAPSKLFTGNYAKEIAEAKDGADIDTYGLRSAEILTAPWVCDASVARTIVQILLQRSLNVVKTYTFRLSWAFAMLEPMDIVTLTDLEQGLNKYPVRITSIEEDTDGAMTITAEDFPIGSATATAYPTQSGQGFIHDRNVDPGSINVPTIFEAPAPLTGTGLQIWAACLGTSQYWGGCSVWVSLDGSNYRKMGELNAPSRHGVLSGAISGGSLPVALNGNKAILTSGSATDASALVTLCYIGGAHQEYLAYQTATLTSAQQYTLTGLVRGAYGTDGTQAHSTSDLFVRCDSQIFKSADLDPTSYVGKTVHLKFTSFNVYGGAEQSLADVTEYTYAVTGAMAALSVNPGAIVYSQAVDPATQHFVISGSLWFDTAHGNRPYVRQNGTWVLMQDASIKPYIDSSWWAPGATQRWSPLGGATNSFDVAVMPDGVTVGSVWKAVSTSAGGAQGGWVSDGAEGNNLQIDTTKTYLFACFVQNLSGDGQAYWGPSNSTGHVCNLNTSTVEDNPYFVGGSRPPTADQWYLMVGYIFPAGSTGLSSNGAGMFDCVTGALAHSGVNWCWKAGISSISTRAYQYYGSHVGDTMIFASPMVFLCDGTEPALSDLLTGSYTPRIADAATRADWPLITHVPATAISVVLRNFGNDDAGNDGTQSDIVSDTAASDGSSLRVWDGWTAYNYLTPAAGGPASQRVPGFVQGKVYKVFVRAKKVGSPTAAPFNIYNETQATTLYSQNFISKLTTSYQTLQLADFTPNWLSTDAVVWTWGANNMSASPPTTSVWVDWLYFQPVNAAEGATVNRMYWQNSAPESAVDGDVWADTSSSPVVLYLRVSGSWVSAANLSTGQLAQLDSVATAQIGANAATEVLTPSTSSGTYPKAVISRSILGGIVFTPAVDCVAEVTVELDAHGSGGGTEWGAGLIGTGCCLTADLTAAGDDVFTLNSTNTPTQDLRQGLPNSRAHFTLSSRFSVLAGSQYRAGALLKGQHPDVGLYYYANADSAPLTHVSLIKR